MKSTYVRHYCTFVMQTLRMNDPVTCHSLLGGQETVPGVFPVLCSAIYVCTYLPQLSCWCATASPDS